LGVTSGRGFPLSSITPKPLRRREASKTNSLTLDYNVVNKVVT
jgi:hypothetical protein